MDAASLEVVERGGQRIQAQSLAVERHPDGIDAEAGKAAERAEIGDLLDQHGVTARKQKAIDELDAPERSGGNENLPGRTGNPRPPLWLLAHDLPPPPRTDGPASRP